MINRRSLRTSDAARRPNGVLVAKRVVGDGKFYKDEQLPPYTLKKKEESEIESYDMKPHL